MKTENEIKALTEEEVLELAKSEGVRVGYNVLGMVKLKGEEDYYLRYVLAYSPSKEEYVTWLFNISSNGFNYGRYFSHRFQSKDEAYKMAKESLYERVEN